MLASSLLLYLRYSKLLCECTFEYNTCNSTYGNWLSFHCQCLRLLGMMITFFGCIIANLRRQRFSKSTSTTASAILLPLDRSQHYPLSFRLTTLELLLSIPDYFSFESFPLWAIFLQHFSSHNECWFPHLISFFLFVSSRRI